MKRIAIITGASSGMGLEFAKELYFYSKKYNFGRIDELWVLARRADRLKNHKYDLEKATEKLNQSDLPSNIED